MLKAKKMSKGKNYLKGDLKNNLRLSQKSLWEGSGEKKCDFFYVKVEEKSKLFLMAGTF